MKRARFIQSVLTAAAALCIPAVSCHQKKKIRGRITGASASFGHLLRENITAPATRTASQKVIIIGAGISGLSAARTLYNAGLNDFLILDLENVPGGNAASGKNEISSYPLGAHYIPIPNNTLKEYLGFLEECSAITGYEHDTGLPVYNENMLCHDQQERLFIHGKWQDGIIPQHMVSDAGRREISRFLAHMDQLRDEKGKDGKFAFDIPVNESSKDPLYTELDKVTMKQWMLNNNYLGEYLHWYVNYCCRDDFGTAVNNVSAWAGIHYFASRKGKGANATHSDLLTWPEGNGFLVNELQKKCAAGQIKTGALATAVTILDDGIDIQWIKYDSKEQYITKASYCILAVPQFIAARLLKDSQRQQLVKDNLHYVPWVVANILLRSSNNLEENNFAWDNVIYQSESLGYVDASHQMLQQHHHKRNITYYLPLTNNGVTIERTNAISRTHEDWTEKIIKDLECSHPDIRQFIEEINIQIWGHAMVQPLPGMIHGEIRGRLSNSPHSRIQFAHSDLAGISIFEEAFYQGIHAAKNIIAQQAKTSHEQPNI